MSNPLERARAGLRHLLGRGHGDTTAGASGAGAPELRAALVPRAGMTERLVALNDEGVLGRLLPDDWPGRRAFDAAAFAPMRALERLTDDATLNGSRFGTMLRELSSPELLAVALLVRHARPAGRLDEMLRLAAVVCDRLHLRADSRHIVEFLLRDDGRMARIAFGPDADDRQTIEAFATYLNTASLFNVFTIEEHLKLLCLLTLVTLDGEGALTPLKAEMLWRLFVDTYNHVMKTYGDQVIDASTITRTALNANRPAHVSETELVEFLEGLPKRYLTLFAPETIYEHVRLCRNITADDVHFFARKDDAGWELTVVTLDKPFLFSNVCGVLAHLGMDILDGQALTSTRGLVLDVFRFRDPSGSFERVQLDPLLPDVVAGRTDVAALLSAGHAAARPGAAPQAPIIAFDHDASHRYTVLEIVARDAPGLLYRISRALSTFGCEIEMVIISTEGDKAIDVFHVRRGGAKLPERDELPLSDALERAIEGSEA